MQLPCLHEIGTPLAAPDRSFDGARESGGRPVTCNEKVRNTRYLIGSISFSAGDRRNCALFFSNYDTMNWVAAGFAEDSPEII